MSFESLDIEPPPTAANKYLSHSLSGTFVDGDVEAEYKVFANRSVAAGTVCLGVGGLALTISEYLVTPRRLSRAAAVLALLMCILTIIAAVLHGVLCWWNVLKLGPKTIASLSVYILSVGVVAVNIDALLAEAYSTRCVIHRQEDKGQSFRVASEDCRRLFHAVWLLYIFTYSVFLRLRPTVIFIGASSGVAMYACSPLVDSAGLEYVGGGFFAIKVLFIALFAAIACGTSLMIDRMNRRRFVVYLQARRAAEEALRSTEQLRQSLKAFLPDDVAPRLTQGAAILDREDAATVAVCEVAQFVQWSNSVMPRKAVSLLNRLASALDDRVERLKLKRYKMLGDRYVCGTPINLKKDGKKPSATSLLRYVAMSFEACEQINKSSNEVPLELQFGVETGPILATVVGARSVNYEVFGPAVTQATQLCQQANKYALAVSDAALVDAGFGEDLCRLGHTFSPDDSTESPPIDTEPPSNSRAVRARVLDAADVFDLLGVKSLHTRFHNLGSASGAQVLSDADPLVDFSSEAIAMPGVGDMETDSQLHSSSTMIATLHSDTSSVVDNRYSWLEGRMHHLVGDGTLELPVEENNEHERQVALALVAALQHAGDLGIDFQDSTLDHQVVREVTQQMAQRHKWTQRFQSDVVEAAYQAMMLSEYNDVVSRAMIYLLAGTFAIVFTVLLEYLVTPFENPDATFHPAGFVCVALSAGFALLRSVYVAALRRPLPALESMTWIIPPGLLAAFFATIGNNAIDSGILLYFLYPINLLQIIRFPWFTALPVTIICAIVPHLAAMQGAVRAFDILVYPTIVAFTTVGAFNQEKVERDKFVDLTLGELEAQAAERSNRLHGCLLHMAFPADLVEPALTVHRSPDQMYVRSAEDSVVLTLRLDSFSEAMAAMAGRAVEEAVRFAESVAAQVEAATARCPNVYRIGGLGDILFLVGLFNVNASRAKSERDQRAAVADVVHVMARMRRSSLHASGAATVGPVTTMILGLGVPSFNVLGPAIRRCQGLLGEAPRGYFGADELFVRATGGTPVEGSFDQQDVSWKVRGVGMVRMAALSAGADARRVSAETMSLTSLGESIS